MRQSRFKKHSFSRSAMAGLVLLYIVAPFVTLISFGSATYAFEERESISRLRGWFNSATLMTMVLYAMVGSLLLIAPTSTTADGGNGGTQVTPGSAADPYLISTCQDLQNITNDNPGTPGQIFQLTNDIDCSGSASLNNGAGFEPIAYFTGILNGRGYTIDNLTIADDTGQSNYVGIFTSLSGATVSNLTINNISVTESEVENSSLDYVGSLAGSSAQTTVSHVLVSGAITADCSTNFGTILGIGGLIGLDTQSTLSEVASSASINVVNDCANELDVGGLEGYVLGNTLVNVDNTGSITAVANRDTTNHHLGGLIGGVYTAGTSISNGYNSGSITLTGTDGELSGYNLAGLIGADGFNTTAISVTNSFTTGPMSAPLPCTVGCNSNDQNIAAMLGQTSPGVVPDYSSDYFDLSTTGTTQCDVDGNSSCNPVNPGHSDDGYFFDSSNPPLSSGWDFSNIWAQNNTAPPSLQPNPILTAPDAPTGLNVLPNTSSAGLAWAPPSNTGSSGLTQYIVQYEVTGSNNWIAIPTGSTDTTFTLSGLISPNDYTVEIFAENDDQIYSSASSQVDFVTSTNTTYIISTCQQLQAMNSNLGANYILNQNIDCSDTINWNNGAGFIPVGNSTLPFIGNLNGNGYSITGLYEDNPLGTGQNEAVGLFSSVANSQISNLTLVNPNITSDFVSASLAGIISDSSIANVQVTGGNITLASNQAGLIAAGLIGEEFGSTIIQSSFSGTIVGDGLAIGGLAGIAQQDGLNSSILTNDYAQANLYQLDDSSLFESGGTLLSVVGGLVALNGGSAVTKTYAAGSITLAGEGIADTGGLFGESYSDGLPSDITTDSFAQVSIDSSAQNYTGPLPEPIGGLIGTNNGTPSVLDTSDYFDATQAGTTLCTGDSLDSCSVINTLGNQTSYFDNNHTNPPLSGWDFTSIWGTTSLLPNFVPHADVVPLVVKLNPLYIKATPTPPTLTPTPHPTAAAVAPAAVATITSPVTHTAPAQPSTGTVPSTGLDAIAGAIGHFIAHLPAGVVVAFPYLLFVLLILLGLAALVELGRELRRLRKVQLLIDEQTKLAEERDNFWHLAANYLRAPITLLIGGTEALMVASHTALATSLQQLATSLQSKVADIMKEIEHSQELINIKRPAPTVPAARLLGSLRFWIPVVIVAALAVAGDLVATNFRHINTGLITYATQLLLFLLAAFIFYWMLSLLQRGRLRRRSAEALLHQQEQELKDARQTLVSETAATLNADVTSLEQMLPQLPPDSAQLPILTEGTTRLRRMIATFQLMTQVEQLPPRADLQSVGNASLSTLVTKAVQEQASAITTKHLSVTMPQQGLSTLQGSPELLRYTVSSVLANAVAFSPKGGTVRLETKLTPNGTLLSIEDQGQGIAADQLEHLFKPFIKADGTDALELNHDGLGLSLYLDKIIMEAFGGSITADSTLGHGTTITMTWPNATKQTAPSSATIGQPSMIYPQDYQG